LALSRWEGVPPCYYLQFPYSRAGVIGSREQELYWDGFVLVDKDLRF
jgi:hypothetical protein